MQEPRQGEDYSYVERRGLPIHYQNIQSLPGKGDIAVVAGGEAEKLIAYLHHRLSLEELVCWAEGIMMKGDFEEEKYETLREIVSRLGVADVKAFGLTWEDCERFLHQLGYSVQIEVTAY